MLRQAPFLASDEYQELMVLAPWSLDPCAVNRLCILL